MNEISAEEMKTPRKSKLMPGPLDALTTWLRRAVDGKFGPLGYDFSTLNVKPVGGTVQGS